MFDEIQGLPAHPLLVHAAVVFVPLLVLLAVAYAVVPRWRPKVGWAVAVLAVATPVATWFAKESGEALEEAFRAKGYPPDILAQIEEHAEYADVLFLVTLALAVVAGLLLFVTSGRPRVAGLPSWSGWALSGLVVVLAVVAAVYVFLTGDSGAQAVWQGVV
ncbi:DUF2231 domain-containing protein [Micromonospora echinofusca]|uniref:DUF2231 domain-containing protein n=1 Tax=Micromonospora echinofusca TaxID=47858 RepID=A0ABS3VSL5_MICEH|nr:DUF2231 domain-containing protein [Micromonospora echinofusca]MBO4207379.1 hypothetical protein [Micromonospora echinofusca]